MSIEERKPFIDDAGETDSLDFPRIVRSSNSRNRILTVSVFVNAVLFAICVALSVTVLFLSSSDVQNAGHMITEPYCEGKNFHRIKTASLTAFLSTCQSHYRLRISINYTKWYQIYWTPRSRVGAINVWIDGRLADPYSFTYSQSTQLLTTSIQGTLLRISEEELKLYGSKSIALKGGGYAAGLGVAHNLHCIVRLQIFPPVFKESSF